MVYAHNLWDNLPTKWATIGLLGVFCLLTLSGMSESANVALTLFVGHLSVMFILVVSDERKLENIATHMHALTHQQATPFSFQ